MLILDQNGKDITGDVQIIPDRAAAPSTAQPDAPVPDAQTVDSAAPVAADTASPPKAAAQEPAPSREDELLVRIAELEARLEGVCRHIFGF
jgi:hypothetical protein